MRICGPTDPRWASLWPGTLSKIQNLKPYVHGNLFGLLGQVAVFFTVFCPSPKGQESKIVEIQHNRPGFRALLPDTGTTCRDNTLCEISEANSQKQREGSRWKPIPAIP